MGLYYVLVSLGAGGEVEDRTSLASPGLGLPFHQAPGHPQLLCVARTPQGAQASFQDAHGRAHYSFLAPSRVGGPCVVIPDTFLEFPPY